MDEILDLVAKGHTSEAIDLTIKAVTKDSPFFNDLIILKSRHNELIKLDRLRVLGFSEVQIKLNQIRKSLLEIIEILDEGNERSSSSSSIFNVISKITEDEKIKILFLSANPLNSSPLRLDKEVREIESELLRSKKREQFELIKFSAVRVRDLQTGLLDHAPHFVHFSGHGTAEGIALLDNKTDNTSIVKSRPLANLFRLFSNDVACVFLNSCYSRSQGLLIKEFIPNIIGMNREIPDDTAIEFATSFYRGIAAGRDIDFSFEFAKNSIDLNNYQGTSIVELL